MGEKNKFDMKPVIKAPGIEAESSGGNTWIWADGQHIEMVTSSEPGLAGPALVGGGLFSPDNKTGFISGIIGPCGIPRSEWGLSPYRVGTLHDSICRSNSGDCIRCPMNPNRSENEE